MTSGCSFGSGPGSGSLDCKGETGVSVQFPVGLRVLVVDDDVICLKILEQMLRRCLYHVTSCSQATAALNLLRERRGCFDVVLSDVHMPDMDGFKLLELVGLEMDLPVIMMSADGRTNLVLRGIRHGACDYLIKPIREEQLKNIWQHVIRKKWNENKEHEHSGSVDDKDRHKRGGDDNYYALSVNEGGDGIITSHKKKRNNKEDDSELETDEPGGSKKARVVWSVELHQQFVSAVNQLGIDKAVPKRILELMNVPGLTRENVASHLQKFRLYLKRLSGVAQGGGPNSFYGSIEQNPKLTSYGKFEIQALAASGQIPPQTLMALQAELLGQPTANVGLPVIDHQPLMQPSKCMPMDHVMSYGQTLPSNITKKVPQPAIEDVQSGLGAWHSNNMVGNYGQLGSQNGHNMLLGMLQSQSQSQSQQLEKQSITVQPSRLVVPTQSSANFQAVNSGVLVNQTIGSGRLRKKLDRRLNMAGKVMQAVWYTCYGGGPAGLKHVEIPIPAPGTNEILMKIEAASINPIDWKIQNGFVRPILPRKFPFIPVGDVAGEVVEVGPGVKKFKAGDKIVSTLGGAGGGLAEYAVAKESSTVPRPPEVSAADGASLVIAGCTALHSLTVTCGLKLEKTEPRTNILITAASGGVGHYAVQLAKLGNTHVTATCGARNINFVKSLGADEVLDYKTPEGAALKSPSGQKFDIVVNCTTGIPWSTFEPNLTPTGKVVDITPSGNTFWTYAVNKLTFSKKQIYPLLVVPKVEEIDCLVKLVKEGKIKTVVDSRYPLSQAEAGWAKSIEGHATGKVVVEP